MSTKLKSQQNSKRKVSFYHMMMSKECMIMNIHSNFGNRLHIFIFHGIVFFLIVYKIIFTILLIGSYAI